MGDKVCFCARQLDPPTPKRPVAHQDQKAMIVAVLESEDMKAGAVAWKKIADTCGVAGICASRVYV